MQEGALEDRKGDNCHSPGRSWWGLGLGVVAEGEKDMDEGPIWEAGSL